MEDEIFESQRYGRNKKTQIDKSYINSGNYRRKFDGISNITLSLIRNFMNFPRKCYNIGQVLYMRICIG
jgi:hypothetical protein